MQSPLGELRIVASALGVVAVLWPRKELTREAGFEIHRMDDDATLREAIRQLREYFAGRRRSFELDIDYNGTAFQTKIWKTIATIPYGELRTYGETALLIGSPRAARAVGTAIGANPIGIVVPDHRVVGAGGQLSGSAAGKAARLMLFEFERGVVRQKR